MKKLKKPLSIFLALMILVSSLSVSAIAFAAEKEAAVKNVEDLINSFSGDLAVADPTAQDLAAYNEVTKAYKDLSAYQQDSVDVFAFDKLLRMVYDRERQVSIKDNPSIKPSDKQHYINAHNKLGSVIGAVPQFLTDAIEMNTIITNSSATSAQKEQAMKKGDYRARLYTGAWYKSYNSFYYKIDQYPLKPFEEVVKAATKEYLKDNPFTEAKPDTISRPNEKDYEGGASNPEYQNAYKEYMDNQKVIAEYNCRKSNHENKENLRTMQKIAGFAAEYKPFVDLSKDAMDAKLAFDADNSIKEPAKKVVEKYETLSKMDKMFIDKSGTVLNTIPKQSTSYWTTENQKAITFYKVCIDIGNSEYLDAFVKLINSINEPYTRNDIETARAAYEKVPTSLVPQIPEEISEKYKDILASIKPDVPSMERPDVGGFDKTNVAYPEGATKEEVAKLLDVLNSMLSGLVGDLPSMVKTGVFTNATVAMIAQLLFPLLSSVDATLLSYGPNNLATALKEDKFAGAVASLDAITSKDENGKVIKNMDDWVKLTFNNGDMGFNDGDKEGFLDALAALFRPVSIITLAITLENTISTTNGTYKYGAYEDLVAIFETLELDNVMSSHEYTLYVKSVEGKDSNMKMDARIRPILVPVISLIESIAADPLNSILDLLPKVGMLLENDLLDTQIHKLASKVGFVTLPEFSLKTADLFNMIAPALQGIEINGVKVSLTLNQGNFIKFINEVAGCGNGVVKDSITRENAYRLGVDPDKADTFLTMFRWVYGEITTKDNLKAIKLLISAIDLALSDKVIAMVVVELLGSMKADEALGFIVDLVVPTEEVPQEPTTKPDTTKPTTKPTVKPGEIVEDTSSNGSNSSSGGSTGADKVDVPDTGDTSVAIFVAMGIAAAGVYLTKKKKDQ